MKIHIKYFSALRDITGKTSETIEIPNGYTLGDVINWFFKNYPKAEVFKEELLVLVNGRSLDWSYELKECDEVALMVLLLSLRPPLSPLVYCVF